MIMTKNYFTDEQVEKIAVNAGFPVAAKHMKEELRTLMNLAVEAAIGEPVRTITFKSDGWYEKHNEYDNKDIEYCIKEKIYVRNLYSVKELEN